ncbi:hypothetical protein AAII07_54305 [Microvirga sp. 0TCS3.31]
MMLAKSTALFGFVPSCHTLLLSLTSHPLPRSDAVPLLPPLLALLLSLIDSKDVPASGLIPLHSHEAKSLTNSLSADWAVWVRVMPVLHIVDYGHRLGLAERIEACIVHGAREGEEIEAVTLIIVAQPPQPGSLLIRG